MSWQRWKIERVEYADLDVALVKDAIRCGLEMRDSPRTMWFAVRGVGFAGVTLFKRKARMVSAYVTPEMRRRGIRTELIRVRLAEAARHGCTVVNLITSRPEWYEARGWKYKIPAKKDGWHWMERDV